MEKTDLPPRLGLILIGVITFLLLSLDSRLHDTENLTSGVNARYLPLVTKEYPIEETLFGIQADLHIPDGLIGPIDEAGAFWVRPDKLDWASVEITEGERNWGAVAELEEQLMTARSLGLEVILTVTKTPPWAQAVPPYSCGKIKADKLGVFATFMYDLVSRYSIPPFEIKHWEIWSEPDIAPAEVPDPNSGFGCWGDENEPNFGGDYFADMLDEVYPQIKAADPEAQVIIGGLLLDCDPRIPNGCSTGEAAHPLNFLEGILSHHGANDGGMNFDGIAFHAYDFYFGSLGRFGNQNWASDWDTTGPVISSKYSFIEETLSSYGVDGKFILNTEGAILCDTCPDDPDFELTKAYYIAQSYAHSVRLDLKANIWFSILGWRNSGLINSDLSPRPGFTAFKTTRDIIQDAAYLGPITAADISNPTGVSGYKFYRGGKMIWVIWSLDGLNHSVTLLPGIPDQAKTVFGTDMPITQFPVITLAPTYLIWE